jgi:hypothetical protein
MQDFGSGDTSSNLVGGMRSAIRASGVFFFNKDSNEAFSSKKFYFEHSSFATYFTPSRPENAART